MADIEFTNTVLSVVGARPHFVKAYPLVKAMEGRQTKHILLHTGQHYDRNMSDVFFEQLRMPAPDIHLGVGSGSHAEQTSAVMLGVERALFDILPKAVVVYGDTNSTLGATLAAAKYYFPLVHIEAGVRCDNRRMPEEINRKIIDHTSDFLITPSVLAVENLRREGITRGVLNLGDLMYDTFLFARAAAEHAPPAFERYGVARGRYILSTIHRELATDTAEQLIVILDALGTLGEDVVLPMHPRTRHRLKDAGYAPRPGSRLQIVDPVGYLDMLSLLLNARKVVTDSGGLQKEAYWCGVPCVTVMNETTWPETIEAGWNELVGMDMDRMREAVAADTTRRDRPEVYGPPGAARRLVEAMGWN